MTKARDKFGVTLVEMLVVLGIIAVLATIIITLTRAMDTQSKERSTAHAFALLRSALREYYEDTETFPLQPNKNYVTSTPAEYDELLLRVISHVELLYGELNSAPASRQILKQVDAALVTVDGVSPVPRISDPWGVPLDYIYVDGMQFPELVSAGPDKRFGTNDDISSRGM
jgi:prepilin-type N-terminal cleavage/methylation domain-containing protein